MPPSRRGTSATLAHAARMGQVLPPAAEALLDAYQLIAEQIRLARRYLLAHGTGGWPLLAPPSASSCPRVYQLALELVAHGDGCVEHESLVRFPCRLRRRSAAAAGRTGRHADGVAPGPGREPAPPGRAP
ncbi:hypothetical protein [Massilia sp. Se16.2.3]|uniref:hypothetical protein n=1 Tax=Massilia sp. Se16.2.3 TaxID=2709303 RepID=UPI0016040E80|nr:hypothetical protein [Massilia sp. Se16.2.3]QNA97928.1 hypothetical protein G4G31_02285 [Massilia sp. Se16.2.3]